MSELVDDASARHASRAWLLQAGAFTLWVALRLGWRGPLQVLGVTTPSGELPFLYLDLSWLALAVFAWLVRGGLPGERAARLYVAALTLLAFVSGSVHALTRYYRGDALAWDLGNFVQPMWRAAAGLGMTSTWHGDRPLWGDHGSFALFLFTPLTRLFDDAATGPLLAQAALAAAALPALYLLARSLELGAHSALLICCALFSSRALSHATSFDFHPECALPLLLSLVLLYQQRHRLLPLALCVLLAASLKDMAALIVAAACAYLALRERDLKLGALSLTALLVALLDIALLPRLTGWASYLTLNTSAPVDLAIGLKTSAMRALATGLAGSLHPFGLLAGAPWTLAAGLSPKLLVKGVQFQYGFLFVGPALLGSVLLASWLTPRTRRAPLMIALWSLTCVAVNAPRPLRLDESWAALESFRSRRALLSELVGADQVLASDACSAAYLMERPVVLPLCQIDAPHFAATGQERWDVADPRALTAPVIVAQRSCTQHGRCWGEQLTRAARQGYRVVHDQDGWLLLRKTAARSAR